VDENYFWWHKFNFSLKKFAVFLIFNLCTSKIDFEDSL
jgi:hypothetical protein